MLPISYSALSTCKEHYPKENPTTLKSLCELNHFQTSGVEICCCAQWMKYSVGDANWMFLEYLPEIMNYKKYTKCFSICLSLCFQNVLVMWFGLTCVDKQSCTCSLTGVDSKWNLLWLVQIHSGTHSMSFFVGWKDVPNEFIGDRVIAASSRNQFFFCPRFCILGYQSCVSGLT